ncbi:unnamed protein product, partial [Timema podura]|nr:unnamed protein product [Timema podura]
MLGAHSGCIAFALKELASLQTMETDPVAGCETRRENSIFRKRLAFCANAILLGHLGGNAADDSSEHATLPRKDVIRRLRERGEPILLFGETEVEAFVRLRRSEILEPEVNK